MYIFMLMALLFLSYTKWGCIVWKSSTCDQFFPCKLYFASSTMFCWNFLDLGICRSFISYLERFTGMLQNFLEKIQKWRKEMNFNTHVATQNFVRLVTIYLPIIIIPSLVFSSQLHNNFDTLGVTTNLWFWIGRKGVAIHHLSWC